MSSWVTKYFLPVIVIALIAAVYFDSNSVERVTLDASYGEPVAVAPRQRQTTSRPPLTREPQASAAVTRSRLAIGERYNTLEELEQDLLAAGFVRVVTLVNSGQLLLLILPPVVMRSSLSGRMGRRTTIRNLLVTI